MTNNNAGRDGNTDIKEYWEKRLNENYGLHGTGYIGLGKNYNSWMYKVRKFVVTKKLRSLNNEYKSATILDIGSGSGFYVDIWKQLGAKDITGCDITSISVKNLKTKYPMGEFLELDISSNVIPISKQFDFISAFDVLFHIVDDERYEKALSNIYSLLKPGGILIFSENFVHKKSQKSSFQSTRTLMEIRSSLERTGFEIIERTPMFYLMNAPVDSDDALINKFWYLLKRGVSRGEKYGSLIGFVLYPLEIILVLSQKESPSTEMMICKKT